MIQFFSPMLNVEKNLLCYWLIILYSNSDPCLCVFWFESYKQTHMHTKRTKIRKKSFAYSTRCSQAVTHPSTNRARSCLTSVIGRELVFSTWYGRRYCYELGSRHMLNLKSRFKWFTPVRFRTLLPLYTPVFITHFFQLLDTNDATV